MQAEPHCWTFARGAPTRAAWWWPAADHRAALLEAGKSNPWTDHTVVVLPVPHPLASHAGWPVRFALRSELGGGHRPAGLSDDPCETGGDQDFQRTTLCSETV